MASFRTTPFYGVIVSLFIILFPARVSNIPKFPMSKGSLTPHKHTINEAFHFYYSNLYTSAFKN